MKAPIGRRRFVPRTAALMGRLALLFAVLVGSAALASAADLVQKRPGQTLEALAREQVPASAELMHPVVKVDLGPVGQVAVALYRATPESTNYRGVVLLPAGEPHRLRVTALPPMREANGLFDIEIASVLAADVGKISRALVVLYRYYRLGSAEDARGAGYVYSWSGNEWELDEARSRLLRGVATAAQARAKLKAANP